MKTSLPIIACLLAALPVSAQWQLIDDFQQWEDGQIFMEATEIGWNAFSYRQIDEYWMLGDPFDSDNIAMYVGSNHDYGYAPILAMKALPNGGIDPGETGTLFFRCLFVGLDVKWNMATADKPLTFDAETGLQTSPGAWDDLNALIQFERGVLEHQDGDGNVPTNPQVVPSYMIWCNFWMVMENTWDRSTTPPTCTGTYTLYIQGEGIGDGLSPTLIPVGTDPPKDSASFRRAPADENGNPQAIIWAVFATNSGPPGSPSSGDVFLLDDFYYSQGKNLSSPRHGGGDGWAGYPIFNASGDVDTGDWMGWVNVKYWPFMYQYSVGWIYMEEPAADASGAWGYIFK